MTTYYCDRPDMDDMPHREWICEHCEALNSMWDGKCQFCEGHEPSLLRQLESLRTGKL